MLRICALAINQPVRFRLIRMAKWWWAVTPTVVAVFLGWILRWAAAATASSVGTVAAAAVMVETGVMVLTAAGAVAPGHGVVLAWGAHPDDG